MRETGCLAFGGLVEEIGVDHFELLEMNEIDGIISKVCDLSEVALRLGLLWLVIIRLTVLESLRLMLDWLRRCFGLEDALVY